MKSVFPVVLLEKKPYVNKVNRAKRIAFAKTYQKRSPGFCNNVLWSDEDKFNLFGSDGKVIVRRMPKEEFDPKCTVPTVKHAGGNVKCWDCFSTAGIGTLDGNMTGNNVLRYFRKEFIRISEKIECGVINRYLTITMIQIRDRVL